MNADEMSGKWKQLKGSAKAQWSRLTDDDLGEVEGKIENLVGKIQERYGIDREIAKQRVEEWRRSL